MSKAKTFSERFEQICSDLIKDGYRVTGSLPSVRAMKHPNGNRFTIVFMNNAFHYLKNGRLVKSEPFARASSARVKNPKQ